VFYPHSPCLSLSGLTNARTLAQKRRRIQTKKKKMVEEAEEYKIMHAKFALLLLMFVLVVAGVVAVRYDAKFMQRLTSIRSFWLDKKIHVMVREGCERSKNGNGWDSIEARSDMVR